MPNSLQTTAPWGQQKALASDGSAFAWFGSGVAVSGSSALVSARNARVDGRPNQGAVYAFSRTAQGSWRQVQKLVGRNSAAGDQFGATLAMRGGIAFVTAPNATVGSNIWQGRVHVFLRAAGDRGWSEAQTLTASDGLAFDTFGTAVEFTDEYAFVGAGGANNTQGNVKPRKLYVFRRTSRTGDHWQQVQVIDNPEPADVNSSFAASLAASGDRVFVGARSATVGANIGQGIIYPYRLHDGVWSPDGKISDPTGKVRDNFGASIALQGDVLLVGAPGAVSGDNQGTVYRYDFKNGLWQLGQKFAPNTGESPSLFGAVLGMSGDFALVGAYAENGYRGAAYLFRRKAGAYTQLQKLTASDASPNDVFGHYVALDGTTALVGAYPKKNGSNVQEGAAYFYSGPSLGPAPGGST